LLSFSQVLPLNLKLSFVKMAPKANAPPTTPASHFGPQGSITDQYVSPYGPNGFTNWQSSIHGPNVTPYGPNGFSNAHVSTNGPQPTPITVEWDPEAGRTKKKRRRENDGPNVFTTPQSSMTGPNVTEYGPNGFTNPQISVNGPNGFTTPQSAMYGPNSFTNPQSSINGPTVYNYGPTTPQYGPITPHYGPITPQYGPITPGYSPNAAFGFPVPPPNPQFLTPVPSVSIAGPKAPKPDSRIPAIRFDRNETVGPEFKAAGPKNVGISFVEPGPKPLTAGLEIGTTRFENATVGPEFEVAGPTNTKISFLDDRGPEVSTAGSQTAATRFENEIFGPENERVGPENEEDSPDVDEKVPVWRGDRVLALPREAIDELQAVIDTLKTKYSRSHESDEQLYQVGMTISVLPVSEMSQAIEAYPQQPRPTAAQPRPASTIGPKPELCQTVPIENIPNNDGPTVDVLIMARSSKTYANQTVPETLNRLRQGSVTLGPLVARHHAGLGRNIGTVYTSERIEKTRDRIIVSPNFAGCDENEAMIYHTLEHIRSQGHSVIILERGYDGISNDISLRLFLAFWIARGLRMEFQIFQKSHNGLIEHHQFVQNHMTHYPTPALRFGYLSRLFTATDLVAPPLLALDIHRHWHLLHCISQGKLHGNHQWYNHRRNTV
jgi:hypothetical protein